MQIIEVRTDSNGMTTYFHEPAPGAEVAYVGWAAGGQRGGVATQRAAFCRQAGLDPEQVCFTLAPRPPREEATPQGLSEVAQGCWSTPAGDVVVVELRNGAWVRVPGTYTGRGPEGDAIRYEPGLGMAIAWADTWLREVRDAQRRAA